MADNTVNETGFSPAQIRTISEIIAAALAQDRAQNQVPPTSSNQPIVEGREAPEHTLGHQASADNTSPTENELIKQMAELKDKVERISVSKEKDPVINFHVTEYVLKPTNSTSSKHTLFEENDDPRSHLSESIRVAQMNQYGEEDVLRGFPQTSYKNYMKRYDGLEVGIRRAGLNFEELYNKKKKTSRGFGNYRSSNSNHNRNVGHAATNQLGSSNTVRAVKEKKKREFTDLGMPLSAVMRSCIENGVLSKLPINPFKPIQGRFADQDCEYHQCKGHSTDNCLKLRHDIQDLIDSGKITKPPEHNEPAPGNF
ncbi:hypothetical protein JCGZ_13702 [Jatropha curcas]|uniref:Retrotransposon gag domain-containing protein n=1 Tax=Jatropha curcas TaxID=180498 RepID=A0A067K9L1_JATCU|nr:hypothetical protein JCGZ_13702 [Jatropha curcas]